MGFSLRRAAGDELGFDLLGHGGIHKRVVWDVAVCDWVLDTHLEDSFELSAEGLLGLGKSESDSHVDVGCRFGIVVDRLMVF